MCERRERNGEEMKTVGKWDSLQFSPEMMPVMDTEASGLICICWGESGAEALQIANQSRPWRLTAILTGCLCRAHSPLWVTVCGAVIAPNEAGYLHLLWFGKGQRWQGGPKGTEWNTHTVFWLETILLLSSLSVSGLQINYNRDTSFQKPHSF